MQQVCNKNAVDKIYLDITAMSTLSLSFFSENLFLTKSTISQTSAAANVPNIDEDK